MENNINGKITFVYCVSISKTIAKCITFEPLVNLRNVLKSIITNLF